MASAVLVAAVASRFGFLTAPEVAELAAHPTDRLTSLLVRCGRCRFVAPAQDVDFIIKAITAAGDYARDVSLPVGVELRVTATTADMHLHTRPEVRRVLDS